MFGDAIRSFYRLDEELLLLWVIGGPEASCGGCSLFITHGFRVRIQLAQSLTFHAWKCGQISRSRKSSSTTNEHQKIKIKPRKKASQPAITTSFFSLSTEENSDREDNNHTRHIAFISFKVIHHQTNQTLLHNLVQNATRINN